MAASDREWTLLERLVLVTAVGVLAGIGLTVRASSRRRAELDAMRKLEAGLDASGSYEGRSSSRPRSARMTSSRTDTTDTTDEPIGDEPPVRRSPRTRSRARAPLASASPRPQAARLAVPEEEPGVELPPGWTEPMAADPLATDEGDGYDLTPEESMLLIDLYSSMQDNDAPPSEPPSEPMAPENPPEPPAPSPSPPAAEPSPGSESPPESR